MATYNMMKRADRDRKRTNRKAELAAVRDGTWPRTWDDQLRWFANPTPFVGPQEAQKAAAEYVALMCQSELDYIDGLEDRIAQGTSHLENFEA